MRPTVLRRPSIGSTSVSAAKGPTPRIDLAACSRCGLCLIVCPSGAIDAEWTGDDAWWPWIDERRCIRCDDCELGCPDLAVETPFQIVLDERSLP